MLNTIKQSWNVVVKRFWDKKTVHTTIFTAYCGYIWVIYQLINDPNNTLIIVLVLTLFIGYFIGIQVGHLSGSFSEN